MGKNRKSLSLKTRFDVFKRDDFTCRYCGRKTPNVILQVDHVVPVAEGGDNEIENLVTSCFECNNGKGAGLLSNLPEEIDIEAKSILLAEKERQLREYNEIRKAIREREDDDIIECSRYWAVCYPYSRVHLRESFIRGWLKKLPVSEILEAIEITADSKPASSAIPYFIGVLNRKYKDMGGTD